jgi:hypothetical protein
MAIRDFVTINQIALPPKAKAPLPEGAKGAFCKKRIASE